MTVADITIVSTTTLDPFDSNALENRIKAALEKVVEDGKIGIYDVPPEDSIDVGYTTEGTLHKMYCLCFVWELYLNASCWEYYCIVR